MRELSCTELMELEGGVNAEGIVSGVLFGCVGVGCLAVAVTPGLNVAVAAGLAYAGSWGLAGAAASTIYGVVAK